MPHGDTPTRCSGTEETSRWSRQARSRPSRQACPEGAALTGPGSTAPQWAWSPAGRAPSAPHRRRSLEDSFSWRIIIEQRPASQLPYGGPSRRGDGQAGGRTQTPTGGLSPEGAENPPPRRGDSVARRRRSDIDSRLTAAGSFEPSCSDTESSGGCSTSDTAPVKVMEVRSERIARSRVEESKSRLTRSEYPEPQGIELLIDSRHQKAAG